MKNERSGLTEVFYSLTEAAIFASGNGLKSSQIYLLKDLYQMILRTASMGIYIIEEENFMGYDQLVKTSTILGTTVDDIYLKKDCVLFANFNHRIHTRLEIENLFEQAFNGGVLRKELINKEERYVIDPGLKEFVSKCWNYLFIRTLNLVKYTIILKKVPKKDANYSAL